jgi:histidinol-phosphate aminotransferase
MDRRSVFEKLATEGVCGLHPYVPGKPVDELEREYGVTGTIKLASNENPLGPPSSALDAIRDELPTLALYPDGSGYHLKNTIAEHCGVESSGITLGNGSNDVLVLLAETLLGPDVEAVFDQYGFIVYKLAVQATGAVARIAPSHPVGHAQPHGHDLAAFEAALTSRTRLVYIANPNNPTGTWLAADELHRFLNRVPDHTVVVIDEAYGEYVTRDDYPDTIGWLQEFPNLVITRTFSKIYGLAGLRIGYGISHPDLAELLNRVRQPFNVNSPAQVAAVAAMRDVGFVERSRSNNRDGLEFLRGGLTSLGLEVNPSIGNFLLVNMGRPVGPIYEHLLRAGIIVRPVGNYGLPNHLRITVGLPEQNQRLLDALESDEVLRA